MYAWSFRRLPGPLWVRVLIALGALLVAVLLLLEVVFPWAAQFSPISSGPTIGEALPVR